MNTPAIVAPWPCDVCGREWRGFGFKPPKLPFQAHFCSFECTEVYMTAARKSLTITKDETAAAMAGGKAAGAYLDEIGKTDLADMTQEEWETFCAKLFAAACDDLARQARESIPF